MYVAAAEEKISPMCGTKAFAVAKIVTGGEPDAEDQDELNSQTSEN